MANKRIAILGLGHIGSLVAAELKKYEQVSTGLLNPNVTVQTLPYDLTTGHDFSDPAVIEKCLDTADAVIATTPYMFNEAIAKEAARRNIAYFDVTEDVHTTDIIKELDNTSPMVPQCGLAPGMVSILANKMASTFDAVDKIEIRVGALPQTPNNHMRYNFTWSTIGLINEYCNECDELVDGNLVRSAALGKEERIVLNGMELEAATTSGGIGTLAASWATKAKNVNYKTLRYPGHFQYMRFLRDDLGMKEHKQDFEKIFNTSVPRVKNDLVVIIIFITGLKDGKLVQESYDKLVLPLNGYTAIQLATACGLLSVVDVWLADQIDTKGFTAQEDISFDTVAKSKYSKVYISTQS